MKTPFIIKLPKIEDARGRLTFMEEHRQIPFSIKNIEWFSAESFLLTPSEKFERFIVTIKGFSKYSFVKNSVHKNYELKHSIEALYIPENCLITVDEVSTDAIMFVISNSNLKKLDRNVNKAM